MIRTASFEACGIERRECLAGARITRTNDHVCVDKLYSPLQKARECMGCASPIWAFIERKKASSTPSGSQGLKIASAYNREESSRRGDSVGSKRGNQGRQKSSGQTKKRDLTALALAKNEQVAHVLYFRRKAVLLDAEQERYRLFAKSVGNTAFQALPKQIKCCLGRQKGM